MPRKVAPNPSEHLYRLLVEGAKDHAIFMIGTDGRIASWNPGAERILGYTDAEAIGMPFAIIFTDADVGVGRPEDELDTAAESGRSEDERWHVRKDGSEFWASGVVTALRDRRGELLGFAKVMRDMTDRKLMEMQLAEAKEAAERANRAKDEFLAVLSHELRTPLMPVLVAISAMLEEPDMPAGLRPMLEMTKRNVELESKLIGDLFDVSRLARGKLHLDLEVVDAHLLIRQVVGICRSDINLGRLELAADLSAGDHHVRADAARLQQVLWNLVKNAVKFTPTGGRIGVRTRNQGRDLVIEVSDTGIGIDPEVLPRIFDAFEQGDALITRQFGGLGLGLAISRSLVEAHRGAISATSGGTFQGATFTVELPTVASPPTEGVASPLGAEAAPAAESLRILLVEDDRDTLSVLARLLGRRHAVTTATDVRSALQAVEAGEFDLIVSDLGLPDGTGLELMEAIMARRPTKAIALTGYGMEADIRRTREAGFVAHLTKPIDVKDLEATIQRIAQGNAGIH